MSTHELYSAKKYMYALRNYFIKFNNGKHLISHSIFCIVAILREDEFALEGTPHQV